MWPTVFNRFLSIATSSTTNMTIRHYSYLECGIPHKIQLRSPCDLNRRSRNGNPGCRRPHPRRLNWGHPLFQRDELGTSTVPVDSAVDSGHPLFQQEITGDWAEIGEEIGDTHCSNRANYGCPHSPPIRPHLPPPIRLPFASPHSPPIRPPIRRDCSSRGDYGCPRSSPRSSPVRPPRSSLPVRHKPLIYKGWIPAT